jgi:CRISPR-associated exonuclease Cas4
MMDSDTDYLQLSGLQHFAFCPRQWALIHLEQQWSENLRTVEGKLLHNRAHDASLREHRGNTLILRELSVFSHQLGLSGKCDVNESTDFAESGHLFPYRTVSPSTKRPYECAAFLPLHPACP